MRKLRLKAASDQIVAEQILEKKSSGGIIIPETAQGDPDRSMTIRCRVVALGPGTLHVSDNGRTRRITIDEMVGRPVKVDDVVLCSKYMHTLEVAGRKFRIIKAEQVLAVEG